MHPLHSYYKPNFFFIAAKGVSANLLQVGSKRRRTKAQIEEEKQLKLFEEAKVEEKLAEFDVLQ